MYGSVLSKIICRRHFSLVWICFMGHYNTFQCTPKLEPACLFDFRHVRQGSCGCARCLHSSTLGDVTLNVMTKNGSEGGHCFQKMMHENMSMKRWQQTIRYTLSAMLQFCTFTSSPLNYSIFVKWDVHFNEQAVLSCYFSRCW